MLYRYYESKKKDAETVVLSHDIGLHSTCWDELLPGLNEHYSILTYDLEGYDTSSYIDLSWECICSDLHQLIDQLNITHYHLIGHGFGSTMLEQYAVSYPDWQGKIVLISPPKIYSTCHVEKLLSNLSFIMNRSMSAYADYILPKNTLKSSDSREYQKIHSMIEESNCDLNRKLLELLRVTYTSFSDIRKVRQHTLVILGEHDIFNSSCYAGLTSYFYMNCQVRIIENASNYTFIDNPQDTVKQIVQFLQKKENPIDHGFRDEVMEDLYTSMLKFTSFVFSKHDHSLPTLRVNMLDQYQVKVNDHVISGDWDRRNAKRLLAYLVFHPYATREQICDALWPHLDISRARANLRVYLSHLKSLFKNHPEAQSILRVTRETIELNAQIECDAIEYLDLIEEAIHEANIDKKRA